MPVKTSTVALLCAIFVSFALWAAWGWSPYDFGYLHDDSLYLSAGRSIAQGEAYRFPSLPVDVGRTKYPLGYLFLLSLVWKVGPAGSFGADGGVRVSPRSDGCDAVCAE